MNTEEKRQNNDTSDDSDDRDLMPGDGGSGTNGSDPGADGVDLDLSGLDPELQRRIDEMARQQGASRQAVLRQILKRALGIKKPDHQ